MRATDALRHSCLGVLSTPLAERVPVQPLQRFVGTCVLPHTQARAIAVGYEALQCFDGVQQFNRCDGPMDL